ncbi:hypothetical protein P692DRAFT_20743804 [Suillus brevipes Sb2]|nr:hypothetical protein P692DRAFT_20743804 [Suillus brevipes Sb2]
MSRDRINQPRNSRPVAAPEICTHSDATAGESSVRPQNKVSRFMRKVKNSVIKKIVQDALSVEQGVDIQSTNTATRNASDATDKMNMFSGPGRLAASAGTNGLVDLNKLDKFDATYLKPLKIFDSVIGTLADV